MIDYCTAEGARILKGRIARFWADKDKRVSIHGVVGSYSSCGYTTRMDLRSDMVNGLPREACHE